MAMDLVAVLVLVLVCVVVAAAVVVVEIDKPFGLCSTLSMELSNDEWVILEPLIPRPKTRRDGRGRPWTCRRKILNAVIWILL